MARLVVKSRVASALPALEPSEMIVAARAWAQILEGEVPDNYLEQSYVRAMRDKETTFALSAPEIVQAYRNICQDERAAPPIPMDRNLLPGNVCGKCFGIGMEVPEGRDAVGYKLGARRCSH